MRHPRDLVSDVRRCVLGRDIPESSVQRARTLTHESPVHLHDAVDRIELLLIDPQHPNGTGAVSYGEDSVLAELAKQLGVTFVDLMNGTGLFTKEEVDKLIEIGLLNALFVWGRSIGFIGHILDQKRMDTGLYRHPWDDILFIKPKKKKK